MSLALWLSFPCRPFWWTALVFSLDHRFLQRFTGWGLDGSSRSTAKVFPSPPPTHVVTKNITNGTSAFLSQRREATPAPDLIPPCLRGELIWNGVTSLVMGMEVWLARSVTLIGFSGSLICYSVVYDSIFTCFCPIQPLALVERGAERRRNYKC